MFFLFIAAVSAGTFERDAVKADLTSQEFRSLAVSSDGKYLAAGDSKGNLHIYNLQTSDYTCLQVNSGTLVYFKNCCAITPYLRLYHYSYGHLYPSYCFRVPMMQKFLHYALTCPPKTYLGKLKKAVTFLPQGDEIV